MHSFQHMLHHHDPIFTGFAILVLATGALLTMRLFARVRRTAGSVRLLWLFLTGFVGGGTVWSTHFLAMIAYRAPVPVTYEVTMTVLSLAVAVAGVSTGFLIAAITQRSIFVEAGGFLIGLSIAAMHYLGMAAMEMPATIEWSTGYVVASVVAACFFGAITTNRVARPVTRFCKYGGVLAFILAVALLHFTGMTAAAVVPEAGGVASQSDVTNTILGASILFAILVVLSISLAAYWIDHKNGQENTSRVQQLALHDPLTGLANRLRAVEFLRELIQGDLDDTARVAVISIGIDRFKDINDVHGTGVGDRILKTLAERLSRAAQRQEFVARFGGDEFVAVRHPVFLERQAIAFCERLKAVIEEPIDIEGISVTLECSVGYAQFPDAGNDPEDLLQRAGIAMYQSKRSGGNRITAYTDEFDEENRIRSSLAIDLKKAVQEGQLELYYQLQNDARTRVVVGAEALLRWNHPEKGRISPGLFIPIAEETGLICEIGDWVLRQACKEATQWAMPYTVAVNVASRQLTDAGFPAKVEAVLEESGLDPARLEIEITESGIIADVAFVLNIVKELKSLGVRIAMDDYGTGYSSLSTLQNFPFDKIKIDREFVRELPDNKQSAAIIQATTILGNSLDIPVLAEGVETEQQLQFLAETGCSAVQGFFFGKPMPQGDFCKMAEDDRKSRFADILGGAERKTKAVRTAV
ncbi:MAG: bifunctional diguanylate cyclase/phosphodiesterase [Rhizobiaceae bacterium]|nr:bifunctional diguanylate cyclase/phosphodiesterase [Rhizobiaceae bacterium]